MHKHGRKRAWLPGHIFGELDYACLIDLVFAISWPCLVEKFFWNITAIVCDFL
jgi:hypothetical protein